MPQRGEARPMQVYASAGAVLDASQRRDPLLRHLTRVIVGLSGRHAGPGPGVALDIGCGVGRTSLALAGRGWNVVGMDPSPRAVRLAQRWAAAEPWARGKCAFVVGDATETPPPGWRAAFDLAVCSEVIEHVVEPAAVVDLARTALRPGGVLVLTTPNDPNQWTALDDYAGHVRRFTLADVRGLLAGFEVLEIGTEGFPFQRTVMQVYEHMRRAAGAEHSHEAIGDSMPYRLYVGVMPMLLSLDHVLRRLGLGTTIVVAAARQG